MMQESCFANGAGWNTRVSVEADVPRARYTGTKASINQLLRGNEQEPSRLRGADRRNHYYQE
jgi:hypothetical protein